jgi:FkbM family methyltransferase
MQSEKIVYDIGAHKGIDSAYYLQKDYRVVAVEANPQLCQFLKTKFSNEIGKGRLTLIECAIASLDNQAVPFYVTGDEGESSLSVERLKDMNVPYTSIYVQTKTLSRLFEQFGPGIYCKMDIENLDVDVLRSLHPRENLPQFFSVELSGLPLEKLVECPEQAVAAVEEFERLGYKRFKLVDQFTLASLTPKKFYTVQKNLLFRIRHKLESVFNSPTVAFSPRLWYNNKHSYTFTTESSGPFGQDLNGEWYSAARLRQIILDRFAEYYEVEKHNKHNIFWVDLHATW